MAHQSHRAYATAKSALWIVVGGSCIVHTVTEHLAILAKVYFKA